MPKIKDFRAPSKTAVKVFSDDFFHSAIIVDTWTPLREEMWKTAYSEGCVSKDMSTKGFDKDQTLAAIKQEEIIFQEEVKKVMEEIMNLGDPELLDVSGKPKIDAIGSRLGRKPTNVIRNRLFKELIGD